MNDIKRVQDFFNQQTQKHGASLDSLDWGSRRSQEIRFQVFEEIASLDACRLLDVGCGFADFFHFLTNRCKLNVHYTGVDISQEILKETKKANPELDIRNLDILTQYIEPYDYVFGSGIHNIKVTDNYALTHKMLTKMFALSKRALATNFLDASADSTFAEHIFGYEEQKITAIAKELSPFYSLRHDYLPHDFTLYLYKEDWAQRSGYAE